MKITETTAFEKFNKAIDIFFGYQPANPYWILLAMYLRKKDALSIVDDYNGSEINIIAPIADKDYWYTFKHTEEWPAGIDNKVIVGKLEGNDRLIRINEVFNQASQKNFEKMRKPFSLNSLFQWEAGFLLDVTEILLSIDLFWFEENFDILYDRIVRRIMGKGIMKTEEKDASYLYPQPKELTALVKELVDDDIKLIYNPFAGIASYSDLAADHVRYYGEEKNTLIAAIADLSVLSKGISGEVKCFDSIHDQNFCADIIISTPPFGQNISDVVLESIFEGRNDCSTLLLRKCAKYDIKGVIVCPYSLNFRRDYCQKVREYLVQKDCIDMIINLPANLFENTSTPISVYVINKNHSHKGFIRFIDASNAFYLENKKSVLDVQAIMQIIRTNGKESISVPLERIAESEYSFVPEIYMTPDVELHNNRLLFPLSEIGEFSNIRSTEVNISGKYINATVISNPNMLKILTTNDFDTCSIPQNSFKLIHDCVLISGRRNLKGICINTNKEVLYAHHSFFCFIPGRQLLPQYLVLQLSQDYVQKQVGPLSYGSTHMPINKGTLEQIKIIVPSIEEQQKTIDEYQDSLIKELGMEVSSLKNHHFNEYERNMHLRKHALKQIMNEVLPASRRIANFISDQEYPFKKDAIIAERSMSTLESYAAKLYQNIDKINSLISALTEDTDFDAPEIIDLTMFIANYRNAKITEGYDLTSWGRSEFLHGEPSINEEDVKKLRVGERLYINAPTLTAYIAPSSLTTVFDNIIANAVKYGFSNRDRKDYAIKINFRNIDVDGKDMIEILIANNGEKLPTGMSVDRMFKWGVGTGTGLGSWQTKNIIEHYGGTIEFFQYDKKADGFNIEYRITLPMNP